MNMYKRLLVLFLFFTSIYSEGKNNKDLWNKLYHSSSSKSAPLLNSFYVSGTRNLDFEKQVFLELLNTSEGHELACNFPARYTFLKEAELNVRAFNLSECKGLTKFLSDIQKKFISVVMTSELIGVPASSFGHVMLVLHDEEKPSLNSDVIHFSAITNQKDNSFEYLYKGINGGYDGYYSRVGLYKKINEYIHHEQRFMYFYKLNFDEKLKEIFFFHLYELRKAKFKYYFFNENCAFRIENLLNILLDKPAHNNTYTLPLDPLRNNEKMLTKTYVEVPAFYKIKQSYENLNDYDKRKSKRVISGDQVLFEKDSNELKDFLKRYYLFSFKKNGIHLPNFKENKKNFINHREVSKSYGLFPLDKTFPSKLTLDTRLDGRHGFLLRFRPALIEKDDLQFNLPNESQFSILSIELEFDEKLKVNELDLLHLAALRSHEELFKNDSYEFVSKFDRLNTQSKLQWRNEYLFGKSKDIFGLTSLLVGGGSLLNSKVELYPTLKLIYSYYINKGVKFGAELQVNYKNEEFNKNILSYIRMKLSNRSDIAIKFREVPYGRSELRLSYSYNF